jgi:hypothetical protein
MRRGNSRPPKLAAGCRRQLADAQLGRFLYARWLHLNSVYVIPWRSSTVLIQMPVPYCTLFAVAPDFETTVQFVDNLSMLGGLNSKLLLDSFRVEVFPSMVFVVYSR